MESTIRKIYEKELGFGNQNQKTKSIWSAGKDTVRRMKRLI